MSLQEEVQIEKICKEYSLKECGISINCLIDGYSIALYEEKNKEFFFADSKSVPVKDFKNPIHHWKKYLDANPVLKATFTSVKIIFDTAYFSLIPSELYEEENKKELLSFLVDIPNNYTLITEKVESINAVAIFAVPQITYDEFKKQYPQATFSHSIISFLKATKTLYKKILKGKTLFIDVNTECFNVLCYNDEKLQLANAYSFENENDITYQLVNMMKQFDMDTMRDQVFISGGIEKQSAVYQKLAKYIKNISLVNRPDMFKYSSFFNEMPQQQHFVLFSTAL
jgi:Protein of unknown function (DUF3822)